MEPVEKKCCFTNNDQYIGDHSTESTRAPRRKLHRIIKGNSNIEEWLYCFLGNLAAIEADNNKSKKKTNSFSLNKQRTTGYRYFRSPTPYSWDRISSKSSVEALQNPTDSNKSKDTNHAVSPQSNEIQMKNVRNKNCRSSKNSLNKKFKKHSFLERINRYIRAGIEEGKRRAKRYVRKALAFALEMGYLVPADPGGRLIRISPTLIKAIRRRNTKVRFERKKSVKKAAQKKRGKRKMISKVKRRKSNKRLNRDSTSTRRKSC